MHRVERVPGFRDRLDESICGTVCPVLGSFRLRTRLTALLGLLLTAGCATQQTVSPRASATSDSLIPASASEAPERAGTAHMQERRTWQFADDGVSFSNQLEGARLNGVRRSGPDEYALTIAPESLPINPSPWYGFSVASAREHRVCMTFQYQNGKQRYWPKLSRDGVTWTRAEASQFSESAGGPSRLCATVGPKPLLVFAQNPVGLEDVAQWQTRLDARASVDTQVIGESVQGRPLHMLTFGNVQAKRVLLVLSRQHPPETTGAQALMGFVDQLSTDTPLANQFRDDVFVIVVPLLNPDGVVEGHWRGNANGKDLNRDWGSFTEPETQAVRDILQRELAGQGRTLAFAIDFHSTWHDIFYTVENDPARAEGGVLRQWMDSMFERYPGRIKEQANEAKSTVFKNWAFNTLHAPAVTYEVGDDTSAQQLRELAHFAADSLMQLLVEP